MTADILYFVCFVTILFIVTVTLIKTFLFILKGQMRKDVHNEDLHLFASNLIENRVNFQYLPNDSPLGDIKTCPRSKFHLNVQEWKRFAETAKVLVARVLIDFLPQFSFLKKVTPAHIQHE